MRVLGFTSGCTGEFRESPEEICSGHLSINNWSFTTSVIYLKE